MDEAVPVLLANRRLLSRFLNAGFGDFEAPWPCCAKRPTLWISARIRWVIRPEFQLQPRYIFFVCVEFSVFCLGVLQSKPRDFVTFF